MPQIRLLNNGVRITAGVFCLLFFLHTVFWLGRDVVEVGLGSVLGTWINGPGSGTAPVTGPYDVGLAIAQATALWAAFAGRRSAGGLLAATTVATLFMRLQATISTGSHTSDDQWFLPQAQPDEPTLGNVFLSTTLITFLALIACVVLPTGLRGWPKAAATPGFPGAPVPGPPGAPITPNGQDGDAPQRPAKTAGTVSGLLFGVLSFCSVLGIGTLVWEFRSSSILGAVFTGHGPLTRLLGLSPGWSLLMFVPLYAVGALLSLTRRVSARGFALGLALIVLPASCVALCSYFSNGVYFSLAEGEPLFAGLLNRVQLLVEVFGTIAVLILMGRSGEPVTPGMPPVGAGLPASGWGVPGMRGPGVPMGAVGMPNGGATGPYGNGAGTGPYGAPVGNGPVAGPVGNGPAAGPIGNGPAAGPIGNGPAAGPYGAPVGPYGGGVPYGGTPTPHHTAPSPQGPMPGPYGNSSMPPQGAPVPPPPAYPPSAARPAGGAPATPDSPPSPGTFGPPTP
ncbi:hypothetical protein [Streptomyces sp. NPDC003077]|uniref:hypothetical protein n=1 Tax=Streptomyces sp. NPDC003077 TaxID=3154443 RepID=UPI0033AFB91D